MITQTIGRKLRQYRQKQGYSQEALADRAGLHPTYIGQVERGEKNITVETLGKITAALEIPITAVFEGTAPAGSSQRRKLSPESLSDSGHPAGTGAGQALYDPGADTDALLNG